LTRFKNYYKEVPYIQDFAFEFFGDYDGPDGIVTALREQRIDGVSFVPYSMREKIERKHISLHTLKLPQYTALFFNEKNSVILSEKENRSALTSALDKERIVKEVLKNEGRIIQGPILEGFPGYNPNVSTTIFSQDSANKLLDKRSERISAADYRKQLKEKMLKEEQERVGLSADLSSTTTLAAVTSTEQLVEINKKVDEQLDLLLDSAQLFYRKNKDGSIWELNLVTADTPEYAQAAQLVAGYWQDVGVKVNVKKIDPKEMGRQALKIRDYDVLLYGVIVGGDPDQYSFWHSSQVEYPGLNLSQYESRVVDTILGKIRATIKSEELQSLYTELQNTILDDAPAVFLYTPTYTYALSDKVQGFAVDRIAQPSDRFANVSDWYTKTKGEWKF
jgi:peptide/nickel transport system substrate-binding protein